MWIVAFNYGYGEQDYVIFGTEEDAKLYVNELENMPEITPMEIYLGKVKLV